MSDSDFVGWGELDLDELLGRYTDDDFYEPDSVSTASDHDVDDTEKASKVVMKSKPSPAHACPQCNKEYCSVSGFRGHIMEKHRGFHDTSFKG